MANENEVKTISISIDEYFELREKAQMNMFLSHKLGSLSDNVQDLHTRVFELEQALKNMECENK